MNKYIDAEKLKAEIEARKKVHFEDYHIKKSGNPADYGAANALTQLLPFIDSLQQEQDNNMIQWTGNNLKEVIDFTGKSPRFEEWFKSWDEFESYVHSHGDILKLFSEDGSHYEVPVGAWIVKTPDGYNVPSVSRFVQKQPEVDLEKEIDNMIEDLEGCAISENGELKAHLVPIEQLRDFARHFAQWQKEWMEKGYEQAERDTIIRAMNWMLENLHLYGETEIKMTDMIIADFKRAMED